jgi:hypothetical protein
MHYVCLVLAGFCLLAHHDVLCLSDSEAFYSNDFIRNFSLIAAARANISKRRDSVSPCSSGQILSGILYTQLLYVCHSPYVDIRRYGGCLPSCPGCICLDCALNEDCPTGTFYNSASCIDCQAGSFSGDGTFIRVGCICCTKPSSDSDACHFRVHVRASPLLDFPECNIITKGRNTLQDI